MILLATKLHAPVKKCPEFKVSVSQYDVIVSLAQRQDYRLILDRLTSKWRYITLNGVELDKLNARAANKLIDLGYIQVIAPADRTPEETLLRSSMAELYYRLSPEFQWNKGDGQVYVTKDGKKFLVTT